MEIRFGIIKKTDKGLAIDFGDKLTKEQFNKFLSSIAVIHNLESNKRLYEMTFLNKNDFVDTYNKNAKDMISSSWTFAGNRKKYYEHDLNFNRLFINYLCSIRAFIDHNQTSVNRKFESISKEAQEFPKITKYYFDNFFCYRFFYRLRNYAQHCGMPIQHFNLSTKRESDGSYLASSEMTFDSNELLNNFDDWGPDVKADLKKINGRFSLGPLIEEMTNVLLAFWQAIDSLYESNVCEAAKYIKESTNHLRGDNIDVCIFANIIDNEDKTAKNFERIIIPFDTLDQLDVSGCP